jgi:hypothetical protein
MSTTRAKMLGTALAALTAAAVMTGCDWSSKTDSFNSSQGLGEVNFSGTYVGNQSGGRVVHNSSGRSITQLVISQAGNGLDVRDNNGSRYRGQISGLSFVTMSANDQVIGAGERVAQSQVNWKGIDATTGREIEFVGNIQAVAVNDIRGTTTTTTQSSSSDFNISPPNLNISDSSSSNTTTTTTFSLSGQNTQYRLRGTWIEQGGRNSSVDALAAGSAGVLATTN